jgi:hypothetical protein
MACYPMGRAGSLSTLEEDVVIRIGARPNGLGGLEPEALSRMAVGAAAITFSSWLKRGRLITSSCSAYMSAVMQS